MISKEKLDAQASAASLLCELRAAGFSDEVIAVKMSDLLSGAHPSSTSIRRWRTGRQEPSRTYNNALVQLYQKLTGEQE
tara:strand:+ start:179 stop:415 length:237 start_codon:yes stop_codon:yes gene_type:complete